MSEASAVAGGGTDLRREIETLLHHEARLLDAGRFNDWLALYTPDAVYWVPSRWGQIDPVGVASIIYDDYPLLAIRVRRLGHPRAYVMAGHPRTTHLVSNIDLVGSDKATGEQRTEAAFLMVEHREERQRIFSGRYSHVLRRVDGALKIAFKRVDLANCEGAHDGMAIPF